MREREIEKYLRKMVEGLGGLCYKLTCANRPGVPDRLIIYQGSVWFVEVKNEDGVVSVIQDHMIMTIRGAGGKVRIIRSKSGVDSFISDLREGL